MIIAIVIFSLVIYFFIGATAAIAYHDYMRFAHTNRIQEAIVTVLWPLVGIALAGMILYDRLSGKSEE